jgi:hypothetical protein
VGEDFTGARFLARIVEGAVLKESGWSEALERRVCSDTLDWPRLDMFTISRPVEDCCMVVTFGPRILFVHSCLGSWEAGQVVTVAL